jgi:hypothetical protein
LSCAGDVDTTNAAASRTKSGDRIIDNFLEYMRRDISLLLSSEASETWV